MIERQKNANITWMMTMSEKDNTIILNNMIKELKLWAEKVINAEHDIGTVALNLTTNDFLTMKDGREAQLQLILEMDENDWD